MSEKENITQLIEDYNRRLTTISDMIVTYKSTGSELDVRRLERHKTKQSMYRTFISELEKCLPQSNTEQPDSYKLYELQIDEKPNGVVIRLNDDSHCVLRICQIPKEMVYEGEKVKEWIDLVSRPKITERIFSEEETKAMCKQIVWDYIHDSENLRGTSYNGGVSCEHKSPKTTNIDKWFDKQKK